MVYGKWCARSNEGDVSYVGCRHTGVVVYGLEYFFGGMGIEYCNPVSHH